MPSSTRSSVTAASRTLIPTLTATMTARSSSLPVSARRPRARRSGNAVRPGPRRAPRPASATGRQKRERTTPAKFVRQSVGELRKVVYPTGQQLHQVLRRRAGLRALHDRLRERARPRLRRGDLQDLQLMTTNLPRTTRSNGEIDVSDNFSAEDPRRCGAAGRPRRRLEPPRSVQPTQSDAGTGGRLRHRPGHDYYRSSYRRRRRHQPRLRRRQHRAEAEAEDDIDLDFGIEPRSRSPRRPRTTTRRATPAPRRWRPSAPSCGASSVTGTWCTPTPGWRTGCCRTWRTGCPRSTWRTTSTRSSCRPRRSPRSATASASRSGGRCCPATCWSGWT